jgi:hypothetical protein
VQRGGGGEAGCGVEVDERLLWRVERRLGLGQGQAGLHVAVQRPLHQAPGKGGGGCLGGGGRRERGSCSWSDRKKADESVCLPLCELALIAQERALQQTRIQRLNKVSILAIRPLALREASLQVALGHVQVPCVQLNDSKVVQTACHVGQIVCCCPNRRRRHCVNHLLLQI